MYPEMGSILVLGQLQNRHVHIMSRKDKELNWKHT